MTQEKQSHVKDEIANAVTHGIGSCLAIVALAILVTSAAIHGTAWHVASFSIYGATLVILYLESTLYHALTNRRAKLLFRKLDHMSIYLLIAGSYTPFCLTILRGPLGWSMLGAIWGCAIAGVVLKAFYTGRNDVLSTLLYLVMGWLVLIAIRPMYLRMTGPGFAFMVIGGVAYSGGVYFYAKDDKLFRHAIWHLFVMAGSIFQFFAVLSLLT